MTESSAAVMLSSTGDVYLSKHAVNGAFTFAADSNVGSAHRRCRGCMKFVYGTFVYVGYSPSLLHCSLKLVFLFGIFETVEDK